MNKLMNYLIVDTNKNTVVLLDQYPIIAETEHQYVIDRPLPSKLGVYAINKKGAPTLCAVEEGVKFIQTGYFSIYYLSDNDEVNTMIENNYGGTEDEH